MTTRPSLPPPPSLIHSLVHLLIHLFVSLTHSFIYPFIRVYLFIHSSICSFLDSFVFDFLILQIFSSIKHLSSTRVRYVHSSSSCASTQAHCLKVARGSPNAIHDEVQCQAHCDTWPVRLCPLIPKIPPSMLREIAGLRYDQFGAEQVFRKQVVVGLMMLLRRAFWPYALQASGLSVAAVKAPGCCLRRLLL